MRKNEPKKVKFMKNDLNKMEQKEYQKKKELAKKSKLPKGIFENVGGSDNKLKSSTQMISEMKRKLELYEDKKSKPKPKRK